MKILTQNLKSGKTNILDVPSPAKVDEKIQVLNQCSLISTGTESNIVEFGRANFLNKARQQPDRVKDVINKIRSSGFLDTFRAIKNKLLYPMPMGYSAVGIVTHSNNNFEINIGSRVFTNSYHQEAALVDNNMCVKIPNNVDNKSASFGAIGGIAMQSIKCIPKNSKTVAVVGLGLLGQVTIRILLANGYKCLAHDLDIKKVKIAEKFGAIGIFEGNISEMVQNYTKGYGVDATIIAASSLSSDIVNDATLYTRRKGKIISSGAVGLNLIRDNFFKKQIELVVSNSSGDKNHKNKGSSFENINYFFELLSSNQISVKDLISSEVSFNNSSEIYSMPSGSTFFAKLINYDTKKDGSFQTLSNTIKSKKTNSINTGLIGAGNFAIGTLLPKIKKNKDAHITCLFGREGLPLFIAQKKFSIDKITTEESVFFESIDTVFISTPHETHFKYLNIAIDKSLSCWIEKPLVISIDELVNIQQKMLKNNLVYMIGYNRSYAPWTKFISKKVNDLKAEIEMTINAGKLPNDHWLLNENKCGGRIIGECCHYVDLIFALIKKSKLENVECIRRDRYYQDTGKFIFKFQNGSKAIIDYRSDLPASVPKEKIIVKIKNQTYTNYNWKKFTNKKIFNASMIKKGKGHDEAINSFFNRIKNKKYLSSNEINHLCFSTYISIKMQNMFSGDSLNISQEFQKEVLSKNSNLHD